MRAGARLGRGQRHVEFGLGARLKPDLLLHRIGGDRAGRLDSQRVAAAGALDIVEREVEPRGIADGEEARQRGGHRHRVAHDDVGRGLADLAGAPCHRHHPDSAVEGRDVEVDANGAVRADLDHAGIARQRRLGGRAAGEFRRRHVAAGADGALGRRHAVDQEAVEVAHLGCELALAENVTGGVRALVARQIEDADVNRRQRDVCLLARREIADGDRDRQALARPHQLRHVELDGERVGVAVDGEPGEPQRAAGHQFRLGVHRPVGQRDDIGAGAPVGRNRQRHGGAGALDLHHPHVGHAVADDGQRGGAGEARVELHRHGVAGTVARLVERHRQQVRSLGGGIAAPADIEGEAGLGRVAAVRLDVEPVVAEANRRGDARGRLSGGVELAVGDALGLLHRLIFEAAILAEPLIARLDARQRPADALARGAAAVRHRRDHVEIGDGAVTEAVLGKQRLDADDGAGRAHRQRDAAGHRAAAVLRHAQRDLGLQRPAHIGLRQLGHHGGATAGVGYRVGFDVGTHGVEALVLQADGVALKARQHTARRRLQHDLAGDAEVGARRAVEILHRDADLGRLAGLQRGLLGLQRHLQPLGQVVLDQESGLADRSALGVGIGRDPPGAVRHAGQQRHRQRAAAKALVLHRDAAIFHAVRPLHHQGQRHALGGGALGVAQHGGDEHRLAGAVDAALGIDEGIQGPRRIAALDAAVGEVERALIEVEEGVVALGVGRGDEARRQPALSFGKAGGEAGEAALVGGDCGEHLVVLGDQLDLDAGHRLGTGQGSHQHLDATRAAEGRQAEVGHHEPLRRQRLVIIVVVLGGLAGVGPGRHHIDAGFQLADRLQHREGGGDVLVELGGEVERAGPHLGAALVLDGAQLIGFELGEEIAAVQRRDQIAVADAADGDLRPRRIDRHQRDAGLAGARQDVALAGEAHLGGAVAHIDLVVGGLEQALADGGGQALAQHDVVALAMLDAVQAQLLARRGDRRVGDTGHHHEGARSRAPPAPRRTGSRSAARRRRRKRCSRAPGSHARRAAPHRRRGCRRSR